MGLQHLLCRTAESYSSHVRFRLFNISQAVNIGVRRGIVHNIKNTKTTCNVSNLYNGITFNIGREGTRSTWTRVLFGVSSRMLHHARLTLFKTPRKQMPVYRSLSTSTQVLKDVTLFEHDRTRFFRLLAIFCGGQFLFWTCLAQFAYTGLRDTAGAKERGKVATTGLSGPWSFEMNLGSSAWRYGFTLGCLVIGGGIVGLGALFCSRSVSRVVLHEGGKMVTVSTQSPLGPDKGRKITVPLSQVACYAHRLESPSFIPLRVKGHKFYFLLDKDGTLNNPKLFDVTVGAYRPI